MVVGVSGNGKSSLSKRLASLRDVPYVELDRLCHLAGWREATDEDFRRDVLAAMHPDGWVIDGTYENKLGSLVFDRADTVVWLDLPLPVVLSRLFRRIVRDLVTKRDLFNGNRQTVRAAFASRDALVPYAVTQFFVRRRSYPAKFAAMKHLTLVRLRSPAEVERWMATASR